MSAGTASTSTVGTNNNVTGLIKFIKNNDNSGLIAYCKGNQIKPSFFNEIIINNMIKIAKNKILKSIFYTYKYDNEFILNLLILKKNKNLTYDKLNHLLAEENRNKIIITEEMYKLASQNKNSMALKILFENEYSTMKNHYLRIINKYNLIEIFVKLNDYDSIKNVLNFKNFNSMNLKFEEILIEAIKENETFDPFSNEENVVTLLIKSSMKSPYSKVENKNLILNTLIKSKNMNYVQYFIENKEFKYTTEEINSKDLKGEYPIVVALSKNPDVFDYLMDKGADCNTKNTDGIPLIFLAIYNNDVDAIYSLVNEQTLERININVLDKSGYTPLIVSYLNQHLEIFNYLLDHSDTNQKDSYGHNIFHYVIQNNDSINAKKLCEIGTTLNKNDIDIAIGKTVLSVLSDYNVIPLDYKDNNNNSLLYLLIYDYYCKQNKEYRNLLCDCIEKFIKMGCNINEKDTNGYTPLIYAVKYKILEVVELLLQKGALKIIETRQDNKVKQIMAIDFIHCPYKNCNCKSSKIIELLTE